jgi:hypothetical protein
VSREEQYFEQTRNQTVKLCVGHLEEEAPISKIGGAPLRDLALEAAAFDWGWVE